MQITVYTDPLKPGTCQFGVFTVGDDQNWSFQFSDGTNLYNPTGVRINIGYIKGLGNGTFTNAFQWIDRMNNRHTGSFVMTAGIPSSLTWDEDPLEVNGDFGAWLIKGRTPPSRSLRKIYINDPGSGYAAAPSVIIPPAIPNAQATGSIIWHNSTVVGVNITNGGFGYDTVPTVIFGASTGTLPTGTAIIRGGSVVGVTMTGNGSSLPNTTVVGFTSPTGAAAAATATLTAASGAVSVLNLTSGGSGYTSAPTVAFSSGAATATAALANSTWGLSGLTLTNAGSGYTTPPTISFSGGTGSGATAVAAVQNVYRTISGITITNPGRFNSGTTVTLGFSGGAGTGAAGYATIGWAGTVAYNWYEITSVTITNSGSGYTSAPTVTLTGTYPTAIIEPVLTAIVGDGAISSITLTNPGSGYGATAPTVAFSSGSAAATAQLVGSPVGSLAITGGGSYTSTPTVSFSGGGGSGAAATCGALNFNSGVGSIVLTSRGMGYTSLPPVTFSMDGSSATATPCQAEAAGIETHVVPFVQKFIPATAQGAITSTPYTTGRRDTSGNLVYDDSLLVIRPRYLLQPTLTLQSDALTWAGVFTPVNSFVTALLNYRRSVIADVEIFGAGRLLYSGSLTILRA